MKDALGHGSNPGSHATGVNAIGKSFDISLAKVRPASDFDLRGWDGDFSKLGGSGKVFQPNMRTAEGNAQTVAHLRALMQKGTELDPIEIDRKRNVIVEGHHRYVAAKLEGRKTIKAKYIR